MLTNGNTAIEGSLVMSATTAAAGVAATFDAGATRLRFQANAAKKTIASSKTAPPRA